MLPLGTSAPDFSLPDAVSGRSLSLQALKSDKATLIMFICNHCPFVKHLHKQLSSLAHEYQAKGVSFIAISSNDIQNYPEDAPEKMKQLAKSLSWNFPYLYDESQNVARAYDAACTPDFYLFDGKLKLAYRGRLDDSSPDNGKPSTGAELRAALELVLSGQTPSAEQFPSIGCNIKWKS